MTEFAVRAEATEREGKLQQWLAAERKLDRQFQREMIEKHGVSPLVLPGTSYCKSQPSHKPPLSVLGPRKYRFSVSDSQST
jgi:hypothetical protein